MLDVKAKPRKWQQMKSMPKGKCSFGIQQFQRKIYVLSGFNCVSSSSWTEDIEVYDIDKNSWTTISNGFRWATTVRRYIVPYTNTLGLVFKHDGFVVQFDFDKVEDVGYDLELGCKQAPSSVKTRFFCRRIRFQLYLLKGIQGLRFEWFFRMVGTVR